MHASIKVHLVIQKNSDICHKFEFYLTRFFWQKSKQEKASKREVKTHKNCIVKLTNTLQIQFLTDLSRNLSQIITPFPSSNLWQISIWDLFFVWLNAPLTKVLSWLWRGTGDRNSIKENSVQNVDLKWGSRFKLLPWPALSWLQNWTGE